MMRSSKKQIGGLSAQLAELGAALARLNGSQCREGVPPELLVLLLQINRCLLSLAAR